MKPSFNDLNVTDKPTSNAWPPSKQAKHAHSNSNN